MISTQLRRWTIVTVLGLCYACINGSSALAVAMWPTANFDSANFTSTSSVLTTPFAGNAFLAVHFYSSKVANGTDTGAPVATSFSGISFNNVDINGVSSGTLALTANPATAGASLAWTFPGSDHTGRNLGSSTLTGPPADAATLQAAGGNGFYLDSVFNANPSSNMLFSGLKPNDAVYVQVLGGDDGWNGQLTVASTVGGTTQTAATTAWSDGLTATRALLGFYAQTDASGDLNLNFSQHGGGFVGIGAVLIAESVPEPSALVLIGLAFAGLTATAYGRRARRSRHGS